MKPYDGINFRSEIPVTMQMIHTISQTELPIKNLDIPTDFTRHSQYSKQNIPERDQKSSSSRIRSKFLAQLHSSSGRIEENGIGTDHQTRNKYQRLPMYHRNEFKTDTKSVDPSAPRPPSKFMDVGTDTAELDLMRRTEEANLKFKLQVLEQQLEIAEAQALVFHLSEQLHLARQDKFRVPEVTQPREDRSFKIDETNDAPKVSRRMNDLEYVYESSDILSLDASVQTNSNDGPRKPTDLVADMVTLDNSWLIQWKQPISQSSTHNSIAGYALSIQDKEVKHIDRADFTKTILHLSSSTTYPVELSLQSMTTEGLRSRPATIILKANSPSESTDSI